MLQGHVSSASISSAFGDIVFINCVDIAKYSLFLPILAYQLCPIFLLHLLQYFYNTVVLLGTGKIYIDFLQNELIPAQIIFPKEHICKFPNENIIWFQPWTRFQQDGGPAQFALPVRDFLNQQMDRQTKNNRVTPEISRFYTT